MVCGKGRSTICKIPSLLKGVLILSLQKHIIFLLVIWPHSSCRQWRTQAICPRGVFLFHSKGGGQHLLGPENPLEPRILLIRGAPSLHNPTFERHCLQQIFSNKRIISSVHDQNKTNVIIYLRTGLLYLHCSYDESSMNDKLRKTSRTFVAISTMYKK